MNIKTIASGSKGNAYVISSGRSKLLIECGLNFDLIRKALDFDLSDVAGCLISHEHGDHSAGVKKMLRTSNIKIYASEGTLSALNVPANRQFILKEKQAQNVGDWTVLPFRTEHDAKEPLGFMIQRKNERLLFITDSYFVRYKFKNINYLMIECNYSADILEENVIKKVIHPVQKKRVLQSHFSLENVKDFLEANDLSQLREIHLLHISEKNGDKERFKKEIQAITGIPVYV
ncbi:TPA: MBL fold metallo-hydrolase [Listeria monocytogenes]|uniref:MBL fold metallo-hydrolase n=1 Tax=Listeria monocytogenes TaxID=1639 RepID=UPI0010B02B0A|nr:MBL fold metallo-hydrolase [Listeria monocytogenes]EAC4247950.1 MBL fold metallo-hydrolase [Listeria monocytogenes]EAE4158362.1 MBL fold metallo-hydrolase [Listeria monocytogenes]EAH1140475.1 MBL fold metallo-hydrolase [Listeria monocytogenes]EIN2603747.1 MBL fold metallo-hydrolase [Listeria monocytogenes]EIO3384771.1 MBL fold metallo-hydrolase [Listeria monocytogenes]